MIEITRKTDTQTYFFYKILDLQGEKHDFVIDQTLDFQLEHYYTTLWIYGFSLSKPFMSEGQFYEILFSLPSPMEISIRDEEFFAKYKVNRKVFHEAYFHYYLDGYIDSLRFYRQMMEYKLVIDLQMKQGIFKSLVSFNSHSDKVRFFNNQNDDDKERLVLYYDWPLSFLEEKMNAFGWIERKAFKHSRFRILENVEKINDKIKQNRAEDIKKRLEEATPAGGKLWHDKSIVNPNVFP